MNRGHGPDKTKMKEQRTAAASVDRSDHSNIDPAVVDGFGANTLSGALERALRARFRLWMQNHSWPGLSQFDSS